MMRKPFFVKSLLLTLNVPCGIVNPIYEYVDAEIFAREVTDDDREQY